MCTAGRWWGSGVIWDAARLSKTCRHRAEVSRNASYCQNRDLFHSFVSVGAFILFFLCQPGLNDYVTNENTKRQNVTLNKDNNLKKREELWMQVNQGMPDDTWAVSRHFTSVEKPEVFLQIQAPHLRRQQRPANSPNHHVLCCLFFPCVTFVKPHFMLIWNVIWLWRVRILQSFSQKILWIGCQIKKTNKTETPLPPFCWKLDRPSDSNCCQQRVRQWSR